MTGRPAAVAPVEPPAEPVEAWWSVPPDALVATLSTPDGLSAEEATLRLARHGRNLPIARREIGAFRQLLTQLASPMVLLLVAAAGVSLVVGEWMDASIVLGIVGVSSVLSWWQERRAGKALEKLRSRVHVTATVLRDGHPAPVYVQEVVAGDIVLLSAGSLVPADGVVLEARDFFVNQAVLTGETFPVEKEPGTSAPDAGLAARANAVFLGTSVRSGSARMLVVRTGASTSFGAIAERLSLAAPETEFERGLRAFGGLLTESMAALVIAVFAINVFMGRPLAEGLLFSIALAVGIAPELLPAILVVNLSKGAETMAKAGVIVRRLAAIEDFGSMDVLCTDKTGTLTVGIVTLDRAVDPVGVPSPTVLRLAAENARLQTGLENPLDEAIATAAGPFEPPEKIDEIPYDFVRKRLTVVVRRPDGTGEMVTKGALDAILDVCTTVATDTGPIPLGPDVRTRLRDRLAEWSGQGLRVLGVARQTVAPKTTFRHDDEAGLTFCGFLLFADPPKEGVADTIASLARLGVMLKVVTGDNRFVAEHLCRTVGLPAGALLTGAELQRMSDEALWHLAERTSIFAEVDPNQKERIILALKKTGHVVGYLGDGINDAPALHAADVGLSVEGAVDVAKEAADFVLLRPDLDVLRRGIVAGRTTFANTLKYVMTTESANLGNMLSMAGASLFLPFLPLLAKQILLNNFLSDFPAMAIATDAVDAEMIERPRRWDVRFIRKYMLVFGVVSSAFDFLTFWVLLAVARAGAEEFRTAWFVESLLTELAVAMVVRTRGPAWRSRPGRGLWWSTVAVAALTVVLPSMPGSTWFGFVPLPPGLLLAVVGITALYVMAAEVAKAAFYRWFAGSPDQQ
jgi:Mg2+-importing ATPase